MFCDIKDIYQTVQVELAAVDREMHRAVDTISPTLQEAATYCLAAGGKRLRPLLTILTARLGRAEQQPVVQAAAALELVHLGSLVHDDVIDNSLLRRGQPSAKARYGNRAAVLVGDYFFARALELACRAGMETVQVVSQIISNLVEGELVQLQRNYDITVTEADYWQRIQCKTAAFIAECCRLGVALGDPAVLDPADLYTYGLKLGLAYQVKDDLLDFTGSCSQVGKPLQQDLRDGVVTLPVIHTLQYHPRRQEIGESIRRREYDWDWIIACLQEAGSLDFAEQQAAQLIADAKHCLESVPAAEAKEALLFLADFVLARSL